jgi:hypothetical protein
VITRQQDVATSVASAAYCESQTVILVPDCLAMLPGFKIDGALQGQATFRSVLSGDHRDTLLNVHYPTLEMVIREFLFGLIKKTIIFSIM